MNVMRVVILLIANLAENYEKVCETPILGSENLSEEEPLILELNEITSVLDFEIELGQLTISIRWTNQDGEQMEEEIETVCFENILLLRDFLNNYASPEKYPVKS
jgi:hypothetical protein